MSVARALTLFFGLLSLDAIAAFVLLVVAGIIAPKGLGTSFSIVLGTLLLAIFVAFAAGATIYLRLLAGAAFAPSGRWLLSGLFVVASLALYLGSVLMALIVFNR